MEHRFPPPPSGWRLPLPPCGGGLKRGAAILALAALAACSHKTGNPAPPKITTPAELPDQSSTIVLPITAQLSQLEAGLNTATPKTLWQIDKREDACVPPKRVKVFGKKLKVTPKLGCRIVGQVTRGSIRLGGSGNRLLITLPISATISARDVGGIIKRETATGAAAVRAVATLSVDSAWNPRAKVSIAYDWTDPPGINFLGQRIKFTSKADDKLKGVIAGLERDLPKQLAKLRARDKLAGLWKQGFTTIMLNRDKPPAWMRVTPRRLGFGGYRVVGRRIEMVLSAEALTQTFVGAQPPDPTPTPLPPPSRALGPQGLRFFIPVLADYDQLEPVVSRTLAKLAAKGIALPGIGPVDAEFGKVTIYATENGRLAVGIEAKAKARNAPSFGTTRGEIWLTGVPYNDANSQKVQVRDLTIAGQTDSQAVNLLFRLFDDPQVIESIRGSLSHDFVKDYTKVLTAARGAIAGHREGDFVLAADVKSVANGAIKVTGSGLFLPVQAQGKASMVYRPR